MRSVAAAIATTFFGQAPDSIDEIVGLGSVNRIFVASLGETQIVVRLPQPDDRSRARAFYEKEAWCLAHAAALSLPSPQVLAMGEGEHDGWPYQIQSFVAGINGVNSGVAPERIYVALGTYAHRFHSIALTGFGETLPEMLAPDGLTRWHGFIDYNVASLTPDDPLLALGVYTPQQRPTLRARFADLRATEVTLGLCHGDLSPRNTLLAPDRTLFLLDWGCAEAHLVPHYDLLSIPAEYRTDFLDGYGWNPEYRAALMTELEHLELIKALDLVRWAIDRCPARTDELAARAHETVRRYGC